MRQGRRNCISFVICAFGLLCCYSRAIQSQQSDTLSRVSLTVSGGISLGSYQAGATWGFIFALRQRDELIQMTRRMAYRHPSLSEPIKRYELDILTGASAGNVNAVLAALDYCAATPRKTVESSMLWKSWIPIGFEKLVAGSIDTNNLSLFSRSAFKETWDELRAYVGELSTSAKCDLLIGITVTKAVPEIVTLQNGVDAPAQGFAGIFRITGTEGRAHFVEPKDTDVLHNRLFDILILDPARDGRNAPKQLSNQDYEIDLATIQSLVEASSSFPGAFAPRVIPYRMLDSLNWSPGSPNNRPCRLAYATFEQCAPPDSARFVDGGFIDNRPIGLALRLAVTREAATSLKYEEEQQKASVAKAFALSEARCSSLTNRPLTRGDTTLSTLFRDLSREDSIIADLKNTGANSDSVARSTERRANLALSITQRIHEFDSVTSAAERMSKAAASCADANNRWRVLRDSIDNLQPQQVHRILYYIDDDSRRSVPGEAVDRPSEPKGGLGAALGIALRTFQTGQDREIRVLHKELSKGHDGKRPATLSVNTRFPRLMGEHINHFGAFLARSFREHDFYAGVYDGLRSAFREFYCTDSSVTNTASRLMPSCEVEWLTFVLDSRSLNVTPEGEAVIRRFLAHERTGAQSPLPERPRVPFPLVNLVDANVTARTKQASKCKTNALAIESPLCSEQLLPVLREWRRLMEQDNVGAVDSLCTGSRGDTDACVLVHDAVASYHTMVLRTLERLRKVEARLDKQDEPGYPGLVGVALFAERAFNEQFRSCFGRVPAGLTCWDVNPTSSDIMGGWWFSGAAHVLPVSLGTNFHGTQRWLEWRPTLYLKRLNGFAISVSAPLEYYAQQYHWGAVAGGGIAVIPPKLFISSVAYSRLGQKHARAMNDLTVSMFGGILRVGLRSRSNDIDRFVASNNVTIGIGDVNGISARLLNWIVTSIF